MNDIYELEIKRLRTLLTRIWSIANESGEDPVDMDEALTLICRLLSGNESALLKEERK